MLNMLLGNIHLCDPQRFSIQFATVVLRRVSFLFLFYTYMLIKLYIILLFIVDFCTKLNTKIDYKIINDFSLFVPNSRYLILNLIIVFFHLTGFHYEVMLRDRRLRCFKTLFTDLNLMLGYISSAFTSATTYFRQCHLQYTVLIIMAHQLMASFFFILNFC